MPTRPGSNGFSYPTTRLGLVMLLACVTVGLIFGVASAPFFISWGVFIVVMVVRLARGNDF